MFEDIQKISCNILNLIATINIPGNVQQTAYQNNFHNIMA